MLMGNKAAGVWKHHLGVSGWVISQRRQWKSCYWHPLILPSGGQVLTGFLDSLPRVPAPLEMGFLWGMSPASGSPWSWLPPLCGFRAYFFFFKCSNECLFISILLKNYWFFNWRIIALQTFAVFCQTSTWISHRYTYIPSLLNLPPFSLPIPPLLGWYRARVWVS